MLNLHSSYLHLKLYHLHLLYQQSTPWLGPDDLYYYYYQQSKKEMQGLTIMTAAELRQQYLPALSVARCNQQRDYYQFLTSKGLTVNPKIALSQFRLKNGLPYIGMAAEELITEGEVLIRVPEELVLSSAKALRQEKLALAFQDKFFINESQTWQDRVLVVYCMFLLFEKDESNPWYLMVKNFPQECDIACFWTQEEISSFKDPTVISATKLDLNSFEQEWREFEECQQSYAILQQKEFNYQNYKTIFINLTNRSFGKNFNFVSLVPFAQFFNHHCSKVYYTVEKQVRKELKDENVSDDQSSIGSYDSNDYIEEGEFAYDTIEGNTYNWEIEESYDLVTKELDFIKKESLRLINLLQNDLYWGDFTVLFVGHLMLKLKIIEKEYLAGRKPFKKAEAELRIIENSYAIYKEGVVKYYKQIKKKEYSFKEKEVKKVKPEQFVYPKYTKQYESVVLKTDKFDRFESNNQVYFRYGRNSNRSLLLKYGFAIEGNKYEHLWVSFSIAQCVEEFPDVLQKVMEKKLSLLRKFKIHHHTLNIDIIIFFRLNSWVFYNEQAVKEIFYVVDLEKEVAILEQIISILEQNAENYEGEYNLTDKSLNYHQYFIRVYHKEKCCLIQRQIEMLRKLTIILASMQSGKSKQESIQFLTKSEAKIMKHYIESIL